MIYLDTHVAVWLYAGQAERLSSRARSLIEENELLISPIVLLEMQFLREIGRITGDPALMVENLAGKIGLKYCDKPLLEVVTESMLINWTRDPFDRLIVAAAQSGNTSLLTKDQTILAHYAGAVWE
jgi:PIN domain nuclease of toxin-antitoxin system